MVCSLKEESSDESTIISSQTSTLTRNQGPDDMNDHADDTLKLGSEFGLGDPEVDDIEEDDEMVDIVILYNIILNKPKNALNRNCQ